MHVPGASLSAAAAAAARGQHALSVPVAWGGTVRGVMNLGCV